MAGVGAICGSLWLATRLVIPEPTYRNHPLSYWTLQLGGREFGKSYDAIRAIGPDAVPWLLTSVRSAHSLRHTAYRGMWEVLPQRARRHFAVPEPAREIDDRMAHALSVLDSKGIPRLIAALSDRNHHVRRVAVRAIGRMLLSEETVTLTVPRLATLLSDPDESVRIAALATLEQMGSEASGAIPALIQSLQNDQPETLWAAGLQFRSLAVRTLGRFREQARDGIPALQALLKTPDRSLRTHAAIALWRVSRDTNMVAILVGDLTSGNLAFSPDILAALGEMGPAAKGAVPYIIQKLEEMQLTSTSLASSEYDLKALEMIDRDAAQIIRQKVEARRQAEYVKRIWDYRPRRNGGF